MSFRARGRFEIVAVYSDGAYLKITSHPKRSLPPAEIVKRLREYADNIQAGIDAETAAAEHPQEKP